MSRLTEIIDNHNNLEQLFALLRHYGVNAEFVSASLLNEFAKTKKEEEEDDAENNDESVSQFIEDLQQFYARF